MINVPMTIARDAGGDTRAEIIVTLLIASSLQQATESCPAKEAQLRNGRLPCLMDIKSSTNHLHDFFERSLRQLLQVGSPSTNGKEAGSVRPADFSSLGLARKLPEGDRSVASPTNDVNFWFSRCPLPFLRHNSRRPAYGYFYHLLSGFLAAKRSAANQCQSSRAVANTYKAADSWRKPCRHARSASLQIAVFKMHRHYLPR